MIEKLKICTATDLYPFLQQWLGEESRDIYDLMIELGSQRIRDYQRVRLLLRQLMMEKKINYTEDEGWISLRTSGSTSRSVLSA